MKFSYRLRADYSSPVVNHSFSLMFLPANSARQRIETLDIDISGCERYCTDIDNFKNKRLYGTIAQPHSDFELNITGTAVTGLNIYEELSSDYYEYLMLKAQTSLTSPRMVLTQYHNSLELDLMSTDYDKALKIMNAVNKSFKYVQGATEIHETAENALSLGMGVCQDYAHIMLSLLRMEHIPSRYVVGIMLGEGATHAWVEALCGGYWYGFDPTNNKLVNDEYIRVSVGRDSNDCSVIRGKFYGMVTQHQTEKVFVERL